MSSSSCLRLLLCLLITSSLPSIFPLTKSVTRQLLRHRRPIQSAFFCFIICWVFLSSLTTCNTSFLTRSVQLILVVLLQFIFHTAKSQVFAVSFLQQQPLIFPSPIFPLLSYCRGAAIVSYPYECTKIAPFTNTILMSADDNLYGTS